MRFRTTKTPPPYLNRRDQLRMLAMVGSLLLVVVAAILAGRPENWYWLTGKPGQNDAPTADVSGHDVVDHRVARRHDELGPSVVRVVPAPQSPDDETESPVTEGVQADLEKLSSIEDNTIGVLPGERDAYYNLLDKAAKSRAGALARNGTSEFTYTVLMLESERYRGRLLTLDGTLHRLSKLEVAENEYGIHELYEGWILTVDSGNDPYRVVVSEVPEGLPADGSLNTSVRVRMTGYFFKRFGYMTQDHRLYTAPLLLGKRIRRVSRGSSASDDDVGLTPYIAGFALLLAAMIGTMLWRFSCSDRRFQKRHLQRLTEASSEAISAINDLPTTDVNEMFRQMEQATENEESSPDVSG